MNVPNIPNPILSIILAIIIMFCCLCAWQLICQIIFSPFTTDPIKALQFAILLWPTIFNFWHSDALALSPERQSVRMSEIKNGGLDQYGA